MTPTQFALPVFSARNKPRRTSNGNRWISWISYLLTAVVVSALGYALGSWVTVSLIAFFSNL